MELFDTRENQIDQSCGSSSHTEDEFSIINRSGFTNESLLKDVPCSDNNLENSRNGSEYFHTSYNALLNAFEHLKGNLRKLESENNSLRKQISNRVSSNGNIVNSESMMNSHENDVTKAWEAYSIKLKECEKLRDELRESENKLTKLQNSTKPQSLREDAIRAQTFQDEMKKSFQQLELEKRDFKNKEVLAREELVKEKEYHETVLRATEQKHHAMESEIADLKRQLKDKDAQTIEIKKEHESKLLRIRELTQGREHALKDKIMMMEGKVIQEQEERGRLEREKAGLEEKLSRMSLWKQEVEHLHQTSGLPLASFSQNMENGDNPTDSDIDPQELFNEIESLTNEILTLKQHTSQQSLVISRICEDPAIFESLMSLSKQNNPADLSKPVQCTEVYRLKRKNSSALSSLDTRSVIDESPSESAFGSHTNNNINGIVLDRKIHMMEPNSSFLPDSPHRIEVPPDDENISTAFNNLRTGASDTFSSLEPVAAVNEAGNLNVSLPTETCEQFEHPTSYFSAAETLLSTTANRVKAPPCNNGSLNSDPGTGSSTGSSNKNTLELITAPPQESTTSIRYPPISNQSMKAIWPSDGPTNHTPIWPPDNDPGPSFDVIAALPNNSSQFHPGIVPADDQPPNRAKFQPKSQKDFEAVRVAAQREREREMQQLQENPVHITRPRNRASRNSSLQNSSTSAHDTTPFDHRLRESEDESIYVITDDVEDELSTRLCPVCSKFFDNVNVRFMERHVNGHFNDNGANDTSISNDADSNA